MASAGPDPGGMVVLEISGVAAGGRGVGRDTGGRAWLVEGAVTGDVVEAEPLRVHGRFVEGRARRIARPSPARRSPPCPYQGACGGCPWMVLPEPDQREAKLGVVREALARIGRFDRPPLEGIEAAPASLAYRNKIELSFGRDGARRRVLGLHRAGDASRVEDIAACLLLDAAANRILDTVRSFFLERDGLADTSVDAAPDARVVLRRSRATGEHLVALRGPAASFPSAPALARVLLAAHPEVRGVVRIEVIPGRRGGARSEVVAGEDGLEETLAGIRYRVPAATFFQVNPEGAEILARLVLDAAEGARQVVDLYGGLGVFGLALARGGSHATIVEADAAAVAAGRAAVGANRLSRARFVRAGALEGVRDLARRGLRPDAVVADPPRTGLGPGVAAGIARLRPAKVVLVGCDPATFARDAAALRAEGFRLDGVTAVDLFPQTAHVEAVGVLRRG